ncbi:unnamed protein product [Rotaria sp. Silwood2]|nr:unnamed protein product [Rotaria sp. Silwood2]CAF4182790.1 unnamed protein product [Rotaria sp. Silwood2]
MTENDEYFQRKAKRAKNLSEEETSAFINVWCEYYDRLTAGGSRNIPIYHYMAQQLNTILSPRVMTAVDVKSKISNLVAEYRKKKKDMGKTGGSPCTWHYFDQIDKLLGERPYNDDSLMTDTMIVQNNVIIDDIENIPMNNSNGNLDGEDIDHTLGSTKDFEEVAKDTRSTISSSPSNTSSTQKSTSQNSADSSVNKSYPRKKRKYLTLGTCL